MNNIFKPKTEEELKEIKKLYFTKLSTISGIKKSILLYLFEKGFIFDSSKINNWNYYFKSEKDNLIIYINRFTTLQQIKISLMKDITIMYCGAFKPLTGAHMYIIDKYLQHPNVEKLVLFISPEKRDKISVDTAYHIAKVMLSNKKIEIVIDKSSYSPILAVYRWIEKVDRKSGKYALISSNKYGDYKRVKEFVKNYSPEKYGKNLPKGVEIIELPLDIEPLTYESGDRIGTYISATNVREDLRNNNYEKFKENYPTLKNEEIEFIWNTLKL